MTAKRLYEGWLVETGATPTHFYTYEFSQQRWVVARDGMKVPYISGARSYNLIIPKGVKIVTYPKGVGHIKIINMANDSAMSVPIFLDTSPKILDNYFDLHRCDGCNHKLSVFKYILCPVCGTKVDHNDFTHEAQMAANMESDYDKVDKLNFMAKWVESSK